MSPDLFTAAVGSRRGNVSPMAGAAPTPVQVKKMFGLLDAEAAGHTNGVISRMGMLDGDLIVSYAPEFGATPTRASRFGRDGARSTADLPDAFASDDRAVLDAMTAA